MKKFVLITSCALVLIGCSRASNTDELNALSERVAELEELNNELASENTSLKAERNTPTPEPEPELAYDDFDPKCETTRISGVEPLSTYLYMDVTMTNPTSERQTLLTDIDIYYKGDWVDSTSKVLQRVPAGRTITEEAIAKNTPAGRSLRVADYTCKVAEFNLW